MWGLFFNLFASLDLLVFIYSYLHFFDKTQVILNRYSNEALRVLEYSRASLLENNMADEVSLADTQLSITQITDFELAFDQGLGMLFIGIPLTFFFTLLYRSFSF